MAILGKMLRSPGEFLPPGYEFTEERNVAGCLLGLGMALSLHFFVSLREAVEELYYMDRIRGRIPKPGVTAVPFLELVWGYAGLFLPLYLFLAGMMVYHYLYYYRETKSIYLMRRLPLRGVLWKSCVQIPLLGMGAGAVAMLMLFLLYYGSYLLLVPAEAIPGF
ncbi:MAG: hypothetical protein K2P59_03360 [Acetatifactor sp.]|nr:hypothetical protein [Acetatifactor sp.]